MSSKGIFPINETLLPMFKRRIAGHISQTKKFEELKENNEWSRKKRNFKIY